MPAVDFFLSDLSNCSLIGNDDARIAGFIDGSASTCHKPHGKDTGEEQNGMNVCKNTPENKASYGSRDL